MGSSEMDTSQVYEIEAILGSKIEKPKIGQFQSLFKVKWCKPAGTTKSTEITWEPFANVAHLPLLLNDFEKTSRRHLVESMESSNSSQLSQETLTGVGNFPVISKDILRKLKCDGEYMPKGTEVVKHIYSQNEIGGKPVYVVKFIGDKLFYTVRDCVLQYYFPQACAYYHLIKLKIGEKLEGRGVPKS